MAGEKSKILIIGATGYIGKFITAASARSGHRTFALVRDTAPSDPAKAKLLDDFKSSGVTLIQGDLYDHGSLVKAIKQVDVVISTVGFLQIADQTRIISAIKEAGNVKRFLPSEFGSDVDRVHAVEPAKSLFAIKARIRLAIEAEGIPCTIVSSNFFAGYFLPTLAQAGATGLPTDKVVILGDGNTKGIFVDEVDIGTFTIRAVDDPRTLNKILYLRPPANTLTHNELVSLWEKKVGKTFERVYVPEEEVLKQIQESPVPLNVVLSICHSTFIEGDQTNFQIEPSFGVEATELYPDVKYTTVDEYLNRFL
ncbi:phenylcoumaran benzylic ether reductase Pyrc5-like [Phoenix dactylifera]|uniref:Phenylcoumaran benzylic ether reductase Pyrc5-like n=1 Tax=Phoenix dactylifera TaxID=42345 RepID=A0A8B7CC30_PHODC|nr:phenylcoumaran benzylic ether reductase Pyrc5-like [Phoenix dactylifera]